MIVNAAHDFGFVHIAKCAGSTIRQQLRDKDDFGGRFYHTMEIEGLGRVNGNHLPLYVLEQHFPDALAALRGVTSYTVVRDPLDRFASAMAQRLRGALGKEPGAMTRTEIAAEIDRVIDYMGEARGLPEGNFILFTPQVDYVELDGARVIDRVVPIERMDLLFDPLEMVHGLPIERDAVWNPTVTYRDPRLEGPVKRLRKIAKRNLPIRQYTALRDFAVGLFTTKGAAALEEVVSSSPRVTAFVQERYARDAALHRDALAEAVQTPA